MKRFLAAAAVAALLMVGGPALATVDHCPGEPGGNPGKVEASFDELNGIVLAAGTEVCVKASTGNTGIVIADGTSTLQEILFQAGIVDGSGEQGRDVSYYVVYEPVVEPETKLVCEDGQLVEVPVDDPRPEAENCDVITPSPTPDPEPEPSVEPPVDTPDTPDKPSKPEGALGKSGGSNDLPVTGIEESLIAIAGALAAAGAVILLNTRRREEV